jgi:hypothetical protein
MLNMPDKAPVQFATRKWKFSALGIGNTLPNLRKIFAAFGNRLPRVLNEVQQATKKIALKWLK